MTTTRSINLDIVDDAPMADIVQLETHIDSYNAVRTGIDDARLLSIMLKRTDGELYAGLHGHTWGGTCQIKLLWVAEQERGRGLGAALLEAAESEARRRGCKQVMLATHSFQAPGFYAKYGFEQVATLADNPSGHTDILMVQRLTADT
jgi:GNAT superfamily N-acetyltransferase